MTKHGMRGKVATMAKKMKVTKSDAVSMLQDMINKEMWFSWEHLLNDMSFAYNKACQQVADNGFFHIASDYDNKSNVIYDYLKEHGAYYK